MSSRPKGFGITTLLETKLIPPAERPALIERTALVSQIVDSPALVVAVSAPVGYGKTTLLVQYLVATERPAAWVSLDAADDDPGLLLLEIGTALDRISPVDPRVFRRFASAGADVGTVLPHLVGLFAAHAGLVLVLDDLHLVHAPASLGLVSSLSEHLPAGCRLVLSSREALPVPVARLRARGLLLEVGQHELAFDRSETRALLEAAGTHVDDDAFEALYGRMEGWAAGIYLAALSLRDATDSSTAVREFAGDDRDVVDYLSAEVLAHQSDGHRSFLLCTSLLDRFTAPLCDAVLRRRDSRQVIDDLVRSNLFLVPLDRRREWYRYHHLFSDMLRAELARREPRVERTLHRRAADWHERHGTIAEAIDHTLAAGERRRAAELVARNARVFLNSGRQAAIRHWLGFFSDEEAADYPPLAIVAAWAGGLLGEKDRALRYLALVERASFDGPFPAGESSLQSAVAQLRAAHGWDGVSRMRANADLAYRLEQPGSVPHGRAAGFLGASLVLSGRQAAAVGPLEEAASLGDEGANTAMFALGQLGLVALDDGRLGEAEARLLDALSLIERLGLEEYLLAGPAHAGLASLQVARGEHEAARAHLQRAVSVIPHANVWPWLSIQLRVVTGRVAIADGDLSLAESLLTQARRELARYPDAGVLPRLLATEEKALEAARGGAGVLLEPLTESEQRVLELLPTHLRLDEVGRSLYISRNTVKVHVKGIYRKLGAGSRAEAVARARALGLVEGHHDRR